MKFEVFLSSDLAGPGKGLLRPVKPVRKRKTIFFNVFNNKETQFWISHRSHRSHKTLFLALPDKPVTNNPQQKHE